MKKAAIILLAAGLLEHASAQTTTTTTEAPQTCEDQGAIKHINWDHLLAANATQLPNELPTHDCSIDFNVNTYEFTVDCKLAYLGYSTDNLLHDGVFSLGTVYQMGFDSFTNAQDRIDLPSTCTNRRRGSTYFFTPFNDWWAYSDTPSETGHIANDAFLAYAQPTSYWTMYMQNECNPIVYEATFGWNDLMSCADNSGNKLISVVDDGVNINVKGTFYVNIVSPHVMGATDSGYYRVYPLVQQDWGLTIVKQVNVLSSTGTDLFMVSILSIFEDDISGEFRITVMTQSADYITLSDPILIDTPFSNANVSMVTGGACISSSRYTCGQLFEINVNSSTVSCPPADFGGKYQLGFTVNCAQIGSDVCATFIDDNGGNSISLEVFSNFVDSTCDPQLYTSEFTGAISFWNDADFIIPHDTNTPYVIGQDDIYVDVEVTFPDDGSGDIYSIFRMELVNVFVCTAADASDVDNLAQTSGAGGCLSDSIDTDGLYNIITNGVGNTDYGGAVMSTDKNTVRFLFETFNTGRTTIFVHAQLMLELVAGDQRRRMLLQVDSSQAGSNQIRHFIDETGIAEAEPIDETGDDNSNDNVNNDNGAKSIALEMELIAILVAVLAVVVVVTIAAVWCFYVRMKSNDEKQTNLTASIQADDRLTPRADRVSSVSAVSMANL